jgi:hypothetical protein
MQKNKTKTRLISLLVAFGTVFCLSGCIFPAAWYDPGIMYRITTIGATPEDITEIDKLVTVNKYEFLRQRTTTYMKREIIIRDYQKDVTPSRKDIPPNVYIMFWIDQNEFTIDIQNIYGRKDTAIENEIDSIGSAIYSELIKRLGEAKVTKERLTTGPPII